MFTDKLSKLTLAVALALGLTLAAAGLSQHGAAAQIVRDHRARLCRVSYDPFPEAPGNPWATSRCHLPDNNTETVGSFCTCSVLVQGHYVTAAGSIVLARGATMSRPSPSSSAGRIRE